MLTESNNTNDRGAHTTMKKIIVADGAQSLVILYLSMFFWDNTAYCPWSPALAQMRWPMVVVFLTLGTGASLYENIKVRVTRISDFIKMQRKIWGRRLTDSKCKTGFPIQVSAQCNVTLRWRQNVVSFRSDPMEVTLHSEFVHEGFKLPKLRVSSFEDSKLWKTCCSLKSSHNSSCNPRRGALILFTILSLVALKACSTLTNVSLKGYKFGIVLFISADIFVLFSLMHFRTWCHIQYPALFTDASNHNKIKRALTHTHTQKGLPIQFMNV